jgi:hypothetical protein
MPGITAEEHDRALDEAPPSTRSSSPTPVERRIVSDAVTAESAWRRLTPARVVRGAARASGIASSTSVPQLSQAGHWPSQRGAAWPHCWQTYAVRAARFMRQPAIAAALTSRNPGALPPDARRRRVRIRAPAELDRIASGPAAPDAAHRNGNRCRSLRRRRAHGAPLVEQLSRPREPSALGRAACEAIGRYGSGTGSSRLIAGHCTLHADVEARLATFKRTEAALLFPSGYQANVGTITALARRGDHVFSDALNHASIIDGCRLSRATIHVYEHCNLQSLETMLAAAPKAGRRLIVSDSVFSMDGDRAPLAELAAIAEHYHSVLMVDEAHATGVFGDTVRGSSTRSGSARASPCRWGRSARRSAAPARTSPARTR